MSEPYYYQGSRAVADQDVDTRATFIVRTYLHLVGAIFAFTALEVFYFQSGLAASIAMSLLGVNWLFVLGGFLLVSWIASRVAHTTRSLAMQYVFLAVYVLAQSIIFVPMLFIAEYYGNGVIASAGVVTLLGFGGLTAAVLITRKDFSPLSGILYFAGILALVAIVAAVLMGATLGTWFSVAMIGFAGVAILVDTSNVLHHYSEDRYVAASLELFASVALLFWYVLRLFMSTSDR